MLACSRTRLAGSLYLDAAVSSGSPHTPPPPPPVGGRHAPLWSTCETLGRARFVNREEEKGGNDWGMGDGEMGKGVVGVWKVWDGKREGGDGMGWWWEKGIE